MATATGVSTFIQKILDKKSGISASNLYSFNIQEPQQTSGYKLKTFFKDNIGFDSTAEELTLLCNEIQLPGITYSATDVKSVHKGIIQKMASGKVYNELDISFFLDADSMPLKFFRAWQDFTMGGKEIATDIYGDRAPTNRQQAFAMRYYNHYCCTLDIKKLEKYNVPKSESEEKTPPELKEVWEAKLFGAYPYTVSSIPYSAGPAQLVKVNVGFYYEYSQLKIN
tara:strand:+ start:3139 stop:3813 length:675 start_codon:yes stop_codon:yes gene_type:complete